MLYANGILGKHMTIITYSNCYLLRKNLRRFIKWPQDLRYTPSLQGDKIGKMHIQQYSNIEILVSNLNGINTGTTYIQINMIHNMNHGATSFTRSN
jgi:hypothetical protein